MGLVICSFFLLFAISISLAYAYAKPSDSDEWIFVPTYDGKIARVNLTEEMLQIQPFFSPEQEVEFELFTLKNPMKKQVLSLGNIESVTASNFNKNIPTRLFIHGWQEYSQTLQKLFCDAYFMKAKADVNFIFVNWDKASQTINYISARNKVEPIGAYTASMIDFLVNNDLANTSDITVIGFSLGAHIAGIAGKQVQSKLPKIVGLDPAGPLFSLDKPNERLDRFDAKYVEVIHTSGTFLGFYDPIGTVEFYPNYGRTQVGCKWDLTGTCSHLRAFKYFAESLYSTVSFYGYPCSSFEDMKKGNCKGVGIKMGGEPGNYNAEASIYFLTTNTQSIFARGGSRDN